VFGNVGYPIDSGIRFRPRGWLAGLGLIPDQRAPSLHQMRHGGLCRYAPNWSEVIELMCNLYRKNQTGIRGLFKMGATLAVLTFGPRPVALADDLVGQASVIDGDTLEIHGTRIRLWGVDAPESGQLCRGEDSLQYRCGAYPWLEVKCSHCRTPRSIDLTILARPPETPVHVLEGRLDCRAS
jgi:hypothetical protein